MKLSNLFNDCVRVAQGLRRGSARPAREWLKYAAMFVMLLTLGVGNVWGTVLFHETFGAGGTKARAWENSYSVKSGVTAVYSGVGNYTMTNLKQGNSSSGNGGSGASLIQTTSGTDAVFVVGPLNVSNYNTLVVTYKWKAGSIKGTYSTSLYYKTSSGGSFTAVSGTGNGATTYVTRTYNLPAAAQVSTLYLKVVFNTSNTQAYIDEFDLAGTAAVVTPTLTTDASSMTTLTYSAGSPVAQSFTIGGSNLTNTVTVSAPTNYEVCKTSGGTYTSSISFTNTEVNAADKTVYIRLQSGLSPGNIASSNVTVASSGATSRTVAVTGTVPYTITWMANGNLHATTYVAVGSTLALPATDPVPNSCGCTGKAFYGWYGGGTSYENASVAPSIAAAGNTVNADKTYYAVFADASGGGTKWVLTSFASVTAGVYAIVNQTNHAFNGNVNSSGHGDCTSGTFSFTNNEATSAPDGTCEITFTAVTNGFSMYNSTYGYLYGAAASSGNLAWHNTESSYWNVYSSNWSYSTYHAYLRSYNATTGGIRTYGANNGDGVIKLAKKVSTTTYSNYNTTCCTPLASIKGSITSNTPTSLTLSWSAVTGAEKYQVKVPGSSSHNAWTDVNSTSVTVTKSCGTAYTAYFRAIDTNGSHCSTGPESTLAIPAVSYTVTKTGVTNVTSASLSAIPATTCASGFGPITITAATGYALPADITITNATKSWNSSTGALSISSVTGNVSITITPTCVSPVIGTDPASASYSEGASPSALTVAATLSSGTLTYQWQKSTDSGSNWSNESGTGYNTATYAAANISTSLEDDGVQYRCIVGNSQGGCTVTSGVATITVTAASQCVAPTFSPAAGTYNSAQTVTISSTTPGSTIYYTTKGNTPTTGSSHGAEGTASASVTVSSSQTLKAIAYKSGMTDSDVSEAAYVICSTDPSFSTTSSSNITITGARITCAGITKGTCDIDAYGIVYGTSSDPTGNAQQKGTDASTNVSNYYVDLTGLTDGTTYYARPYATVNGKTVYGTQTSFTTLNIPVITVSETSRAFGTRKVDGSYEMTFTVSGSYLQGNIGLAVSGTNSAMFSVDETSLTPSEGSVSTTTITVTYTPSAAGSHSASVSITSTNATTKTVTLSGTGRYEDTYMTAMHEGVTAWSSYASGVIQTGTGYSVPNPGDIAVGDREGTNCEGKHYHFAGWVEESYKASPSGHIVAASGTKDANNKTFWAVWEKESDSSTPVTYTKVTTISAGTYLMATETNANNIHQTTFAYAGKELNTAQTPVYAWGDTIAVSISNNVISSKPANAKEITVTLGTGDDAGYFGMYDGEKYLTMTSKSKFTFADAISYEWELNNNAYIHNKGNYDNSTKWMIILNNGTPNAPTAYFVPMKDKSEGNNNGQYYYHAFLFKKAGGIVYDDPKVECVCSAIADAGTAALNTAGTFSASQIDVKANDVSAGTDCEFTDYGFVWSSSVTTPTLVEGTGAASTNCTKIQVDDEGTVTSFTGSITGSFSAGNAIYFRSYVKNGKADGTYQYSDVVTVTPRSVTFNLNGHGSSTPAAQLVNNGSKATNPSYSESVTGYIFGDWYKEEGCSNAWNFASDVVSGGNKILYAKWTPISYSVRFNDNDENYLGTASGEMSNESYDYDESKVLTTNAFSLAGYDFAGWALTPTGDVAHADKASVSNLSSTDGAVVDLYAIWTAKQYDVTLAATNETSSVGSQTVTATYNAAMPTTKKGGGAVAAPTRTGYTFTGWEYSSTTYYNYNAGTSNLSSAHVWDQPNSTTTLTPKWSINSYTLTWNLDGGTVATAGTGASAGATGTPSALVEYNSAITVPTVTKVGYNFNGWDVTPANNMPASNTTYTATWTAKPLNNIILTQTEAEIYDQQYVQIDVTYDPADIVTKGYTLTGPALTKVVTTGSTQTQLKISATKAGVTISSTVSETVSIKANANNSKTASVTITINPLPRVHFVDNIHGETFSDVVEEIVDNALSGTRTTPTHSDISDPGASYNACERNHLHLLGWILSTWAEDNPGATHSEIIEAGSGNYYAAGASINVETHNGDTFYAVWSKIE